MIHIHVMNNATILKTRGILKITNIKVKQPKRNSDASTK